MYNPDGCLKWLENAANCRHSSESAIGAEGGDRHVKLEALVLGRNLRKEGKEGGRILSVETWRSIGGRGGEKRYFTVTVDRQVADLPDRSSGQKRVSEALNTDAVGLWESVASARLIWRRTGWPEVVLDITK
ncbi:unnamed protein product [Calypogeia fissa]